MRGAVIAAAASALIASVATVQAQQTPAAVVPSPPTTASAEAPAASAAGTDTPPTEAQFLECVQAFDEIGIPYYRSEAALSEVQPVCREGYALSFNLGTRNPDWVIEHLTAADLRGSAARKNDFRPDPIVGADRGPTSDDYTGSGYDRGHMAPAADAKYDQRVMSETFYMTNMSPQVGIGFNRGQWKYLEEAVRSWILCAGRETLIVMTGPIYGKSRTYVRSGDNARRILVPEAYYKIVYDPRSRRAVGFRLKNQKTSRTDLAAFIVPISQIEDETGLDFFSRLTPRRQRQIENSKGVAWGHDQNCSGVGGD